MPSELPQLSRLSARETWEVIRTSGRKANSLYQAPEKGWAVSVFGEAKSPCSVWCTLIVSSYAAHLTLSGTVQGHPPA